MPLVEFIDRLLGLLLSLSSQRLEVTLLRHFGGGCRGFLRESALVLELLFEGSVFSHVLFEEFISVLRLLDKCLVPPILLLQLLNL